MFPWQLDDDRSTDDGTDNRRNSISSNSSTSTVVDEKTQAKIDELAAQVGSLICYTLTSSTCSFLYACPILPRGGGYGDPTLLIAAA